MGLGSVTILGSAFWIYTDDEAMVLANIVRSSGADLDFVSFEPSDGVISPGESIDVTAKIKSLSFNPVNTMEVIQLTVMIFITHLYH